MMLMMMVTMVMTMMTAAVVVGTRGEWWGCPRWGIDWLSRTHCCSTPIYKYISPPTPSPLCGHHHHHHHYRGVIRLEVIFDSPQALRLNQRLSTRLDKLSKSPHHHHLILMAITCLKLSPNSSPLKINNCAQIKPLMKAWLESNRCRPPTAAILYWSQREPEQPPKNLE